ncbi:subtilase family protein [Lentzea atacamensis]|uniref:Subtilase family protein n=1 Tax=Lentzea atacamensis TaxID=531938 RepID=A0ABX9EMA9_9PSEU|nr:S8 family serine peptidase [Lentzea atacamensis]RAS71266.1 subtilase family protein [Lentzea atacamensis]
MRRARCLMIAVLAAGLLSPVATAQAEPTRAQLGTTSTITLISGDKVVVNERGELLGVEGRPGMRFAQYVRDGHQYVVPADAVDAVGQDRVDKRFFDVTALHSFGYTDDKIDRIPVLDNRLRAAAAVPKKEAEQRWKQRATARSAGKLWLNGKAKISLDESVPMVGAPAAWQSGFDGTGVTVAVLDTGYDQNHPELAGVVAVSKDFTPAGIQDDIGHGTHVAATIAGRSDKYSGVAKGAKLAVGRVCEADWCEESAILAGMDWAAREAGAKVVNMSLGSQMASDGTDPMSVKANELTAETGVLFVAAAGNSGDRVKVGGPAAADAVLAVANLTKSGTVNEWSSQGPRYRDFAVKPDIAAPGTDIVAARAAGTLWEYYVDDLHAKLTGTSMAAPHVAGAAAILAQRNPSWTAAELKAHLMATVKPVADTPAKAGSGLLDVGRAVSQQVRADVGSLSFGLLEWPHTKTFTKTITYSNSGSESVSLALQHDLGADFTVPAAVTVPAGGTAAVDVVLDPRKGNGTFFGHIKASGGGVSLTTSVGAYVQEERRTLTLSMTGRDGKPVPDEFVVLVNMATQEASIMEITDGVGTARIGVGDYAVLGRIDEKTANYAWFTPVSATEVAGRVSVTADTTVTLDARQGEQISVQLPDDKSEVWYRHADLRVPWKPGRINGVASIIDGRVPLYGLSFGAALPELTYESSLKGGQPLISVVGGFPVLYWESSTYLKPGDHALDVAERGTDVRGKLALVRTSGEESPLDVAREMQQADAVAVLWAGPVPFPANERSVIPVIAVAEHHVTVTPSRLTLRAIAGSPVSYTLYVQDKGALPAGTRQIRHSELAEVKARYHTSGPDGHVGQRNYPVVNGEPKLSIGALDEDLTGPVQRTEYYSAGNGVGWFHEGFEGATSWADLKAVTYAPGKKYERSNHRAVASPRFGRPSAVTWSLGGGVDRAGDMISVRISPFGGSTWVENWRNSGYGSVELRHNNEVVGIVDYRQGSLPAAAKDGRYQLTLNAARDTPALSKNVRTTWEFSGAASGRLPLLEVDHTLPVDLRNSWKAGAPMPVKFTASRQSGAGKATIRELRAYASFDDGVNWVPVKSIVPPGGAPGGYVSLRVVAEDTDGNTVDQTVVRAYRLRA